MFSTTACFSQSFSRLYTQCCLYHNMAYERGNNRRGRDYSNRRGGHRGRGTNRINRTGDNDRDAGPRNQSRGRGGRGRYHRNPSSRRGTSRRGTDRHDYNRRDYNRRDYDQANDDATDVQQLRRTIASLQARLDNLQSGRTGTTSTSAASTSTNPDFADVTKTIYKWVQLHHHQNNWKQLPKSLNNRIDLLVNDIRPPSANDDLRNTLKALSVKFGDDIRDAVDKHLSTQLVDVEVHAGSLDPTDLLRAKEIASKYLKNRLGRLDARQRDSLIDSAANMVGIYRDQPTRPPTPTDNHRTSPIPTANRQRSPVRGAATQPDSWHLVTGSPSTRKRPASGTPDHASTNNRFDALTYENDDIEIDDVQPDGSPPQRATQLSSAKKQRPSTDVIHTSAGVRVFYGPKNNWAFTVSPTTEYVLIGDSNLRSATRLPPRWQVECLPGARLTHVAKALRRMQTSAGRHVNVVLQAGINHRAESTTDFQTELRHLLDEARGNECISRIFYAGISVSSTLPEADNIRSINSLIVQAVQPDNYILPLDPSQVNVNVTDHSGIHHTPETTDRIIAKLHRHVDGKPF